MEKATATTGHPKPGTRRVEVTRSGQRQLGREVVTLAQWHQRSRKALSFFPNRLVFARGSWKAHYKPVVDP